MSTDGHGTKWRRNIAENFNRLSGVHERYRQTTGGRATDYEFTFAKNWCTVYYYSHNYVPTGYGTKRHSTVVYIRLYTDTIMYTEACVYTFFVSQNVYLLLSSSSFILLTATYILQYRKYDKTSSRRWSEKANKLALIFAHNKR